MPEAPSRPALTPSQKLTLLVLSPPFILSLLISLTVLITQSVVIHLLDSHRKGNRIHYDRHSTLASVDTVPNNILLATSVVSTFLTVATGTGLWYLRHPTEASAPRRGYISISTIFVAVSNVFLVLACVVVVFVTWAPRFRVYDYEFVGYMKRANRETWLCSLQNRDGDGVGDVQRWGSIGCRMSVADRWLSVALLVLSSTALGMVIVSVLKRNKNEAVYEDQEE